jgi:hypothetical protein
MKTPQRMPVDEFIPAIMQFYRDHADDPNLAFRVAYLSVHDERFLGCVGRGRVWKVAIPYSDGVEDEPEESGCIHVSPPLLDVGVTLEVSRGAAPKTKIAIRLTHHEQMFLLNVLIDYMRNPHSTQESTDVVSDQTIRVSDLLALVATAQIDV